MWKMWKWWWEKMKLEEEAEERGTGRVISVDLYNFEDVTWGYEVGLWMRKRKSAVMQRAMLWRVKMRRRRRNGPTGQK